MLVVAWEASDDELIEVGTELVRAGALLVLVVSPIGYLMRFKPRVVSER